MGSYGDKRKTEIVGSTEDIDIEDLIVEEDVFVVEGENYKIKEAVVEQLLGKNHTQQAEQQNARDPVV